MSWLKGGIIGLIVGGILAIINSFILFGVVGIFFYAPLSGLFDGVVCVGEGCWLWLIIIGDIGLLLSSFVVGSLVGLFIGKKKRRGA